MSSSQPPEKYDFSVWTLAPFWLNRIWPPLPPASALSKVAKFCKDAALRLTLMRFCVSNGSASAALVTVPYLPVEKPTASLPASLTCVAAAPMPIIVGPAVELLWKLLSLIWMLSPSATLISELAPVMTSLAWLPLKTTLRSHLGAVLGVPVSRQKCCAATLARLENWLPVTATLAYSTPETAWCSLIEQLAASSKLLSFNSNVPVGPKKLLTSTLNLDFWKNELLALMAPPANSSSPAFEVPREKSQAVMR